MGGWSLSEDNVLDNHQEMNVVTGVFGYTGKYIIRRLLECGVAVRTLDWSSDASKSVR